LPLLLSMGAHIIAVDIDRPQVWKRLIAMARASPGEITFPIKPLPKGKAAKDLSDDELSAFAGANLLDHTPEIANWLCEVCPEKKVTIGNYTYLDGALHVQLSLACDAIIGKLAKERPELAIAFLCTPTDCHPIPQEAHMAAAKNRRDAPLWQQLSPLLESNVLPPVSATSGDDVHIVDGVVAQQGPNYILAKRIQHWRAMLERSRGHTVSSNIAPSTATASVVHNAQFAAAYGGMHLFRPLEVMYQETSNAVMGALLVHDVRNANAPANKNFELSNPMRLFEYGSFHGGVWRCGYKMGSIGETSALVFYFANYSVGIFSSVAALGALGAWIATGSTGPVPMDLGVDIPAFVNGILGV